MFLTVLKLELIKVFSKWRTYIGFIAVAVIVPLIQLAMYYEGKEYVEMATKTLSETFSFNGELLNLYMVARIVLQGLYVQIPLLVALVGGDLLAGEATSGTFRLLLTRPVSRLQIITAKYLAGLIYTFLIIGFLAFLSFGLGSLMFDKGDMLVVSSSITLIEAGDVPWRFIYTFLYAFLSMATVYTISFTFSSLVENSIGPIMGTMALIIVFSIINLVSVGFLKHIQVFLFTNYLQSWRYFFEIPPDWAELQTGAIVLFAHIIILVTFTFIYFNKKDIQS